MREDAVERPRDSAEVERVDEKTRVADLVIAQPPAKLLIDGPSLLRGLFLKRAEGSRPQVASSGR
jgi:hypothetical protein